MNKTILIALALVVLVGGGFYMARQRGSSSPASSQTGQESQTYQSLQALLAAGQTVSCAATQEGSTGNVYVSGNNMRADFSVAVEGTTMVSHVIHNGDYAYAWSDGSAQGTRINLKENAQAGEPSVSQDESVDLNKQVDLDCQVWVPDATKFTPPANVTFTDLSAMMGTQGQTGAGQTPESVMQTACAQVTDPQAKAACLSAIGN